MSIKGIDQEYQSTLDYGCLYYTRSKDTVLNVSLVFSAAKKPGKRKASSEDESSSKVRNIVH